MRYKTSFVPRMTQDTIAACKIDATKADRWWPPVVQDYLNGYDQPHYPVPAIIVEYEYGRRWPSGQVVLIECIRGPYDDNDDGPYRQWLANNGWH